MEDKIPECEAQREQMFPDTAGQHVEQEEQEVQVGTENDSDQERETEESAICHSRTESEKQLDEEDEMRREMELDRWTDGEGSLADDEDEGEDEEDGQMKGELFAFMPNVTIVNKTTEKHTEAENILIHDDVRHNDVILDDVKAYRETSMKNFSDSSNRRSLCCSEMLYSIIFLLVGAVMFPLLVWGGYELLPFEPPRISSIPHRLVYTLRCALFSSFPIILGMLVYGVLWLKFSALNPLFDGKPRNRHTLIHMNFVRDSLHLLLIFFVQLSVTSTYIQYEALKVVPLLTIVFCFGRLIYWVAECFNSSVRVLGFSLSFLPILVLVGLNLYYTFSSIGDGAVFSVASQTTPPPPKLRWWWR